MIKGLRPRWLKKAGVIFLGIIFLMLSILFLSYCSRQPLYPSAPINGDKVVIDITNLNEGIPAFYSYDYNKKRINFFVIRINGRVSSYLDACSSCYPKRLGFGFDNGYIYCRSCDVRYPVNEIEKGLGSCYPIKIPGEEKDGGYLISIKTLQEGANKF